MSEKSQPVEQDNSILKERRMCYRFDDMLYTPKKKKWDLSAIIAGKADTRDRRMNEND